MSLAQARLGQGAYVHPAQARLAHDRVARRLGRDAHLALCSGVVREKYFTEKSDKKPSKTQSRNAGKALLRYFGLTVRVSAPAEVAVTGCTITHLSRLLCGGLNSLDTIPNS